MKKILMLLLLALSFLSYDAVKAQQQGGFGAGIILGEPTGISLKYRNFASGIAWSLEDYLHLHCDYWIHRDALLKGPLYWYAGAGLKLMLFDDDDRHGRDDDYDPLGLGVRAPLGLQFFPLPELEIFAEIVPGISLFPDTAFDLEGGVGARWYF
jgi:hypothetical protein